MEEQDQVKQSSRGMILSGICSAVALAVFFFTSAPDAQSRWIDYHKAYHNVSMAALVAGVLWFVLALLKAKTNFFVVDRKIGSDELSISIAVLIIAAAVVLYLALSHLPVLSPPPEIQIDPAERARLMKMDKGLNILVWSVVLLAGVLFASLPLQRYFKVKEQSLPANMEK